MGTPIGVHFDVAQFTPFLGVWRGPGEGAYPTIPSFSYLEEAVFEHVGKPFLEYSRKTRHAVEGHPMHAESGWLRGSTDGRIEWMIAQPTGVVEVLEGTIETTKGGVAIDLSSTTIGLTGSAKRVQATRRRYEVTGDELIYDMYMAYGELPVTHHLHATLQRVD